MSLVIVLPFATPFSTIQNSLSSSSVVSSRLHHKTTTTRIHAYVRGTEIWPPVNEEPIRLSSSFPGGAIPASVKHLLESALFHDASSPISTSITIKDNNETTTSDDGLSISMTMTRGVKRRVVRKTLSHILSSAARASSRQASSLASEVDSRTFGIPPPAISKGPAILALLLLCTNCVDVIHICTVIGMTIYILGLASWCAAPRYPHRPKYHRTSGIDRLQHIVNMPSLPTRGHVPDLIKNPLGSNLTGSWTYKAWLRMGALLGVLLPIVALAQLTLRGYYGFSTVTSAGWWAEWMIITGDIYKAKRILGGPLFLLCCQALTEAVARTALLPLPIRILVPVSYNALRLTPIRLWAYFPTGAGVGSGNLSVISTPLRVLGIVNLIYWYANLLFFLVPVGVVRYLRAHYFCVEAVEVTVRKGGESSVGLLS